MERVALALDPHAGEVTAGRGFQRLGLLRGLALDLHVLAQLLVGELHVALHRLRKPGRNAVGGSGGEGNGQQQAGSQR